MSDHTPGDELIDAIHMMNHACERMGVSKPVMIGIRTNMAINAMEREIVAAGHKDDIRQIIGGIEVAGVAIKQRQFP